MSKMKELDMVIDLLASCLADPDPTIKNSFVIEAKLMLMNMAVALRTTDGPDVDARDREQCILRTELTLVRERSRLVAQLATCKHPNYGVVSIHANMMADELSRIIAGYDMMVGD